VSADHHHGTINASLAVDGLLSDPPCALFSSIGKDTGVCPEMIDAPPQRDNASAIHMLYPMLDTDRQSARTRDDELVASRTQQGPRRQGAEPVYVVLATDGAPNDSCVGGTGGDGSVQRDA
jgi:hypothetical protein